MKVKINAWVSQLDMQIFNNSRCFAEQQIYYSYDGTYKITPVIIFPCQILEIITVFIKVLLYLL